MNVLALAVSGQGLVPPGEPVIHVHDEAFMRGRGAFESLRVYGGRPFRLAEHLDRLQASCARLGVELPARDSVEELVHLALDASSEMEAVLRVYATPGHGDGPIALAVVAELPDDLEALRATGIRAITVEFRPADLIGGVKSTSYALNMMAVDEARAGVPRTRCSSRATERCSKRRRRTSGGVAVARSSRRLSTAASSQA